MIDNGFHAEHTSEENMARMGAQNASLLRHFIRTKSDPFTKTGSGQAQGNSKRDACFAGARIPQGRFGRNEVRIIMIQCIQ